MTEGFDKEIDALLRQTAPGETAFAAQNPKSEIQNPKLFHLDADEISLFAENVLPTKARQTAIAHFADCDRCRKILADLIADSAENEPIPAAQIELFPAPIPWYRKFFAFPNLAYTLGALVVAFSGIIGYTVLQTVKNSQNAEVSQVSERQLNGKGMSADGDATIVETPSSGAMMSNSMSNAAMSNSATFSAANSTRSNSAMSNASVNSAARNSVASSTNTSPAETKPTVSANEFAVDGAQADSVTTSKQISELPVNGRMTNNFNLQKQENEEKADKNTSEKEKAATAPQPKSKKNSDSNDEVTSADAPSSPQSGLFSITAGRRNARKSVEEAVETKKVGEKTFERKNNIWTDSAYKNQPTVNVSRGTETFIRLDAGLRSIADNLGGTIIVVWKDKAYRIQ